MVASGVAQRFDLFILTCLRTVKKTKLMHYLFSVYFVNQSLHVSGVFIAHHQEVHRIYTTIGTYCSFYFTACPNQDNRQLKRTIKVKVKAVCGSYRTAALWHIVLLPERVPSFISRGAAHTKRREKPLLAKEGTISGI
jgi:hypothetical protein